jgi:hypothetical protein
MRKFTDLSCGIAFFVACGCGSGPDKPVSDADRMNNLLQSAKKLQNDPNASDQAKGIATGALRQVQSNQDLDNMMNGK